VTEPTRLADHDRPVSKGTTAAAVDAHALAADLRHVVHGEVRFDRGSRALYATDGSNYRQPPIGVVLPRDVEDVARAVEVCRRHGAPIFGRGGGTSLAGQCCNTAVVFDCSKYMNRVLEIDALRRLGRVQPGTILDDLRHAAEHHGITFGPDPATHTHCTLGGMAGNDSCGVHSVMAQFAGQGARTADNIEELEILTYDGLRMRVGATSDQQFEAIVAEGGRRAEIYTALRTLRDRYADAIRSSFPKIPRRVSGYNLPYLLPEHGFNVARALVGSEGTCVMLLEIVANLIPNPAARTLLVLGYPDVYQAGDHVVEIMAHRPIGLEGMDDRLIEDMKKAGLHRGDVKLLPDGKGWLLVELGGSSKDDADAAAHALMDALKQGPHPPTMKLVDDPHQETLIWKIRESGLGATAHPSGGPSTWPGWEDSAVPPEKVGSYLRSLRTLLQQHGYECDLYGHFGQGCIHTRIDFDFKTAEGIAKYRAFMERAADLVISLGGSLSGEHGDGQARAELLPRMFGAEVMQAFREFKTIWDPEWKMNPGKIVNPYRMDEHLRLGVHYHPLQVHTHFQFPSDNGSFAHATLRCVGVGDCRRLEGGTMCPSFMATREEQHSTRGRARLLFEMLEGDPLTGGWQSEPVKEALDLCLACKGCKGDCPVGVDMATYKAEFLAHYYQEHRRPITAYSFGLIHYWARLASFMPRLVNFVTQTTGLKTLAKLVAGMPMARDIPAFAPETFQQWFTRRAAPASRDRPRVILWPDTFNNHFHPETAVAAVHVLERAGFRVIVPSKAMCCGRPLYDYGMLETAQAWLRDILHTLRSEIEAGTPIVGLEPSCVSVFRDELTQLFPEDEHAKRLSAQAYLLSEFLQQMAPDFVYPTLHAEALVHGHCHHRAVMKMDAQERVLDAIGLEHQELDAGCCGMAGSFGFERDHYDLSMTIGERVLLPAVRNASKDALIVADGFSCREQIAQATDRRALHLAEVLEMAARNEPARMSDSYPERAYRPDHGRDAVLSPREVAMVSTGLVAAGAAVWGLYRLARTTFSHRSE
jgi:FAD/FMN-containing dehydrogenase/Fe-S oxidoreductase